MQLETIIPFVAASLVLAFAPGPDNIFVVTQSAINGWRQGIAVTLGLCAGLIVHTLAVAFGVAVIFQKSDAAFVALKLVGAAYLLYLAYRAYKADPAEFKTEGNDAQPFGTMFVRGIVMNVTNPKVAIFFLAFLPQFANPDRGSMLGQVMILGLLFIASAFVAFALIVIVASGIRQRLLRSENAQLLLNRLASVVFVGLAVKLATAHR
jgi:threonine/homoserine/homoserine lactone efflux protein